MTSGQVLDATAAHLLRVVAAEQSTAKVPSLVAGVVRDGALAWWGARGSVVRREDPAEPDPDTQYRVGSITKTMTALLVMQLRDEGVVDLADRLDVHVPGAPFGDRSLRQLLSHSSGLPAEPAGSWWERSPGVSFTELATRTGSVDVPLPAGRQYHYSNLGFALLGEVVARRCGCSWWEALTSRLLVPLEMSRTTYLPVQPAATGFSVHAFAGTLTDEPAQDTGAMAPAGQLWSTVRDLATYAAFLADPDDAIVRGDSIVEMTTVQAGTPQEGQSSAYGLGLRLLSAGDRTLVGHTGSMPGFLAGLFVDAERRTGAIFLANGTAGVRADGLPRDLITTLEQHEPALPAAWVPTTEVPAAAAEILGLWHWGNTALTATYDGQLVRIAPLGEPDGADEFRVADGQFVGVSGYLTGETLRAVRRPDGGVSHLECATFVYTRVPYDVEAPIPGDPPTR